MPPIEAPVSAHCLDPLPTAISICSPDGAIIARFPSGWQREQGFASRCPPVGTDFARTLLIGCRISGLGSTYGRSAMQLKRHDTSLLMELRDGSAWRIWPGDIPKTLQWRATTEIDVADIDDEKSVRMR